MAPLLVPLRQHVEQEGVDVVVESLVIEEELGQKAEVLAKVSRSLAIDFKHGNIVTSIDFVPRRMHLRGARRLPDKQVNDHG